MADNPSIDPGSTPSIPTAADDVGGVYYQRVKLRAADDGSAGADVSAANPLPVVQTGTPALPTGAATSALQTSEATLIGAVTETAPATDTASSGLNGRIQRACQRLTSILAVLPAALGQTTKAGSLSVTLASNQDALPITDNAGSLTVDGTVATTPPANASTNVAQVGGTATDTNSGVKSAGTQRVVLATDQPALTTPMPVADGGGSLTVDNGGTFAVQDSQKIADNAAFTDGTTPVQPMGFVFDEVAGTALTENDAAAGRVDSKRAQVGVLEDATTRGQRLAITAANAAKVDGSAVTQPVSIATNTPIETRATTGAAPTAFTSTTSAQIFASNAARKLFTIYNNSDQDCYLMLAAAAASATSFHVIVKAAGGFFSTTDYSGEIRGIMAATIVTGQVNPGEYT